MQGTIVKVAVAEGEGDPAQQVFLTGGGLATSTTTVRAWRQNGAPVHHVLDPATGHPTGGAWRTVTVAAPSALAANVAEGAEDPILAFEDTGAYRLLLPAMSEDPAELQRFYAETVEPLIAYDDQYETDLVQTVEAFLDADGNVAGTAQRLFTHRHTIRYRLERVKELSGLDVGSTDGREKLSLGLKAMRVLGIAARGGPASEQGARGGRVPRKRS